MDYKNIFKVLALINILLSTIFLSDIAIALLYHNAFKKFLLLLLLFLALNIALYLFLYKHSIKLTIKESILLTNLIWILLGFLGALPLFLYSNISFASAFFEAISGFTTTGATIYSDIEALPAMLLFHRSLMHWLGGLGVIVLSIGLLSIINPTGSISLFKAESTGVELEKLTPKIKYTALRLWLIYLALTLIDAFLLKLFGMSYFDAINHAFSTLSTGGFSTKNSSLGYYASNDAIIWTTTLFMILSGINFLAHLKFILGDKRAYFAQEVRTYLLIFITLSVVLSLVHAENFLINLYDSAKHSFFTIASVMTTTGFASTNYGEWSHLAIAIIFIGMLMGGNSGSTAGGIKTIRFIIITKALFAEFRHILHPFSITSIYIDRVKIKERILHSTFGFILLFLFTVMLVSAYIYARGFDAMTAVSGAFAIVGNIGPGFAQVGPAENFSFFNDFDKILFAFAMIVGRLECYTIFILFSSTFWKKF